VNEKIGFIGLGIMGQPMAGHLVDAGYPLAVCDVRPEAVAVLTRRGARPMTSGCEITEWADIVITMLPDSRDVEEVYLSKGGVLDGVRPGRLLVDMSTISPHVAAKVAAEAASRECAMLDAPVSGGETGARNAKLSIMVGGERQVFDRALPVFGVLGKATYCGKSGAGQVVKACNQIQVALTLIGMAEAMVLGRKAGVDRAVILDVLSAGYAQSRVMDARGGRLVDGDFQPGFRSRLHLKDLNIIREAARAYECCLPGSALAHSLYTAMQANGWGDLDHSAVVKVIELLSNSAEGA
jgi:2-hydroxy-3-oxopropionate reductase